jgi:hypothetical protein
MMRKQNFAMNTTSAIPLFGYTDIARETEIEHKGMEQTLGSIIWDHPNIMAIEPTASSATLGKFMVLVDRECKDDVEVFIDEIFEKVPELDGNPEHFRKPQRGGNTFRKSRVKNISHYLKKLEDQMNHDQLMGGGVDDSEYSKSPPARTRRPTISYAQATKRLSFQNETILSQTPQNNNTNTTQTMTTTMSTFTQSSLNDAIANLRKETEKSINELREELKLEVRTMESSIASAVITAIQKNNLTNMDVDKLESVSMDSSQTTTTAKSMMDRLDSLTQIVQLLAEKVQDIASIQEDNVNKRTNEIT